MFHRLGELGLLIATLAPVGSCGDEDAREPVDEGVAQAMPCGAWARANFRDQPPANASVYGMEYNMDGNFSQYVCRFRDQLDGKPLVLQGKGVFGYSCYAIMPAGADTVARLVWSDDFDVLVDSASCARMVPFQESDRWLPTGSDTAGRPTYSCHALVNSLEGGSQETSMPLGRYEPETKRCVFEWYTAVRAAPANASEFFEVLAVPGERAR